MNRMKEKSDFALLVRTDIRKEKVCDVSRTFAVCSPAQIITQVLVKKLGGILIRANLFWVASHVQYDHRHYDSVVRTDVAHH